MSSELLGFTDFLRNILPSELRLRAKGRPIQIVTDFDGTLCSNYVYSKRWGTHVPAIRADLFRESQRLVNPICIATARTPNEGSLWIMWHKLSKSSMPVVAENGAVLVWPAASVIQQPQIEILASSEQIEIIRRIQRELQMGLVNDLKVPSGHEIVLRPDRMATVEIRAQDASTKKGTPQDYAFLTIQLQELFSEAMSKVEFVSSGRSLGIQPKGINKELGILRGLMWGRVEIDEVFLVGLGDNSNDEPLFNFVKSKGGLTIGVHPSAGNGCEFVFDGGDEVSTQVLKVINSL